MSAKMIHKKLSSSQIILFGFLMVILVGAGLLMLPAAAASGEGPRRPVARNSAQVLLGSRLMPLRG